MMGVPIIMKPVCRANQWIGFSALGTSAMTELNTPWSMEVKVMLKRPQLTYFLNHTLHCNQHCTVKGGILYFPAVL